MVHWTEIVQYSFTCLFQYVNFWQTPSTYIHLQLKDQQFAGLMTRSMVVVSFVRSLSLERIVGHSRDEDTYDDDDDDICTVQMAILRA